MTLGVRKQEYLPSRRTAGMISYLVVRRDTSGCAKWKSDGGFPYPEWESAARPTADGLDGRNPTGPT